MALSASQSIMTINGLLDWDEHLFDEMIIPTNINKDAVIGYILMTTQELEIIYPDPFAMKQAIKWWSVAEYTIWEHMQNISELEYNPLENYDVHDERHEAYSKDEDVTNNGHESNNGNETETEHMNDSYTRNENNTTHRNEDSDETINGSETNAHNVAAFNADEDDAKYANGDYGTNHSTDNTDTNMWQTDNIDRDDSENRWKTNDKTNSNNRWNDKHEVIDRNDDTWTKSHTHGNMGSFSFQELIDEERRVREFNIYQYIADSFKNRFCLLIY